MSPTDTERLESIEQRLARIEAAIDRAERLITAFWQNPKTRKTLAAFGVRL
jgi:hypothetical protein